MGSAWVYLQLLYAALLLCGVRARGGLAGAKGFKCPNKCSGHGACMQDNVCMCQSGWNAKLLPDCSLRECPRNAAWAGKPWDDDSAHQSVECSNMGRCNRGTGTCECFDGFTGAACDRMSCDLDCSGNGQCMTEGDQYVHHNKARDKSLVYTNWDAKHVQGCVCDPGYTGGRCEYKMCPKGNDPIIPTHDFPTYILTTSSSAGTLDGLFKLTFNDKSFLFPATVANWDSAACKRSFESLPNIKTVECTAGAVTYAGGGAAYTIKITAFPSRPYENNIYTHRGQPLLDSFHCDASRVSNSLSNPVTCTMTEVQFGTNWDMGEVYVPLYEQCSNRGICDMHTGSCTCFPNFLGSSCSTFRPDGVVTDLIDVMSITVTNTNFKDASVLHLADTVRGTDRWTSITMETTNNFDSSKKDTLFNMTSWGDVIMNNGGINIRGPDDGDTGLHVYRGGLRLTGGMSIASGGLEITSAGLSAQQLEGRIEMDANFTLHGGLVSGDYLAVNHTGVVVQGGWTIYDGGLMVPHCGYVASDLTFQYRQGLWCDDPQGLVIGAGGMFIGKGGLTVLGGMQVVGGLNMLEPGVGFSTKGVTIHNGGLLVEHGGVTVHEIGMTVARGMTVEDGGLYVTELGVEVGGTSTVKGGLTVEIGGASTHEFIIHDIMEVSLAGIDIDAGGLGSHDSTGKGLVIETGQFDVIGGLRIHNTGVSVQDSGLTVTAGGSSVSQGGLYLEQPLTVSTGGVKVIEPTAHEVNGGISVTAGFSFSHGWLTIGGGYPGAMSIDVYKGGMLVGNGGLDISGGLTLGVAGVYDTVWKPHPMYRKGLWVTAGGMSIEDAGLFMSTGGLTIQTEGLEITAGGANIQQGFTVTGKMEVVGGAFASNPAGAGTGKALNVNTGHLKSTAGGVTVPYGGMVLNSLAAITQGMTIVGYNPFTAEAVKRYGVTAGDINVDGGVTSAGHGNIGDGIEIMGTIEVKTGGFNVSTQIMDSVLTGAHRTPWRMLPNEHFIRGGISVGGAVTVKGGISTGILLTPPNPSLAVTTVGVGGLVVTAGGVVFVKNLLEDYNGVVVTAGGATVTQGMRSHALLWVQEGGMTNAGTVMQVSGGMTLNPNYALVHKVHKDGLVTDSMTLHSILTINTLTLTTDFNGHSSPNRKFLEVVNGGITLDGTVGMNINATQYLGVIKRAAIHIKATGMKIGTGGLQEKRNGATFSSLVEVQDEGLKVTDTGLSVESGGVKVLLAGQMKVHGGLTVKLHAWKRADPLGVGPFVNWVTPGSANVKVHGGLKVPAAGMSVMEGGLNLPTGNLASPDDVNGVTVTGLSDITAGGLKVTLAGMSVATGGMYVHGGVSSKLLTAVGTVRVERLVVTAAGIEVTSGGVHVGGHPYEDAVTITAGNVNINSLTVSAGTIRHSGSLTVTSDRRLKEQVVHMTMAEASRVVSKLRGVYFDWSQDHPHSRRLAQKQQEQRSNTTDYAGLPARRVGFVAQEVQVVLPDLTSHIHMPDFHSPNSTVTDTDVNTAEKEEEALLGVAYTDVVPYLVMGVKHLDARLDHELRLASQTKAQQKSALEAALKDLEGLLAGAERRNGALKEGVRLYKTQGLSHI